MEALPSLELKGCFGTLHEQFLATARYRVVKDERAVHAGPLDFEAARTVKRQAEAAAGISDGDRRSPFGLELLNRDAVYAKVGIK